MTLPKMQVEIRLAESGHSYHYSELTTVHSLMQQIRKDFKIELEDQKIIMKSGQILKSTMTFDSVQELMKKTLSTNFHSLPTSNNKQIKQIQCLYIYNQKELLRPIQIKNFNQDFYLKLLKEKSKQMTLLAQNSYESKNFADKVLQKNVNGALQSINKRLKTPFQDITQRYGKFLQSLNQRNYTKMQISALLDLIQNQDKARKLLIRNIEYLFDRKTKKRFLSISQKIAKQVQKQNELILKQSSSFFSNNKPSQCSQSLTDLTKKFKQVDQKFNRFYEKLKQSKKQVIKQKFIQEQKITFRIDKKSTSIEKQYQQNVKLIKQLFNEFCQQIIKVNLLVLKSKQKQVKDLFRNIIVLHEKISCFEKKVEENIKQFTVMFLELSRIHMKGETQNIKTVFQVYVELIRAYEQLDADIKRMEKEIIAYKEDRTTQGALQVSQFNDGKNLNMPLTKKQVRSPKKQEKKSQKQQGSIIKQQQSNVPKINSPIKNKITRSNNNNNKLFNEQITPRTFQTALKQNKQLLRRIDFNKRLQSLVKYCSEMCEKEQEMRRGFRNSKEFEENKIDLLGVLNVPSVQIDYNETADVQLTHLYKKWIKQNSQQQQVIEDKLDWQYELVQCANSVSKTLNAYLAGKSNITQRQRNLQKILSILSDTFYKMMRSKLTRQVQTSKQDIRSQLQLQFKSQIQYLTKHNQQLETRIKQLQQQSNNQYLTAIPISGTQRQQQQSKQNDNLILSSSELTIKQLQQENLILKKDIQNLSQKLLIYREEVDQTTQKLIQTYEESNAEQVAKLNQQVTKYVEQVQKLTVQNVKLASQLKIQKQTTLALNKQVKQLRVQIQKAKKSLIKQVDTCETLFKQIQNHQNEKGYYQQQFTQLKNMLADKQVAIIKLQKQLEAITTSNDNKSIATVKQQQNNQSQQQGIHECEYQQQVIILRQDKQSLQQQIESLDKELKQILFKQTQDQQIQTQPQQISQEENKPYEQQTKQQIMMNNFIQSNQNFINKQASHFDMQQHHAVSKYYLSSMVQQQWMSTFPTFTPISIGKSIEQGMSHVFLPFSEDIYIGVTVSLQDMKHYSNYQQYLTQTQTYPRQKQPIYILDIKDYSSKTAELIRQCSLVLVVKVDKKSQITMGNKVMVSGKIQYALGFEDDDMTIKNYSHFLDE